MKVNEIKTRANYSLRIVIPVIFAIFVCTGAANCQISESVDAHEWVAQHFAKGKVPPFSFVYGGKSSDNFIRNWRYSAEKIKQIDPNVEETVYTYSDKQSGLVVKCSVTCFNDFHAVEWVLKFSNTSGNNTPLIEKAAVIDHSFVSDEKGNFYSSSCQRK